MFLESVNLGLLRETVQNYHAIEILKGSEKKLIGWKDSLFEKIQAIQGNPDYKNNEMLYNQINTVIKELSSCLELYADVQEPSL